MSNQPNFELHTREDSRKEILLEVLKQAKDFLTISAPDGSKPIIVAFPDELISDVFEQVSWADGFANIFVAVGDKLAIIPTEPSQARGAHGEGSNVLPISIECDMGMLIHGLEAASKDGSTVQLRVHGAMKDVRVLQPA